jgi:hypothetical protein
VIKILMIKILMKVTSYTQKFRNHVLPYNF